MILRWFLPENHLKAIADTPAIVDIVTVDFCGCHMLMHFSPDNHTTVLSLIEAPGAKTRAQEEALLDLENQPQL